jgi:hypothetical protein
MVACFTQLGLILSTLSLTDAGNAKLLGAHSVCTNFKRTDANLGPNTLNDAMAT